ncbi:MAG: type II secretion system protein GspG [Candidatus Methylomirabilales bacterium]
MGPGRRDVRRTGLTLIEIVIILAVLLILIALLVPSVVQQLTAARRNNTLDEMENLEKAIIGDPDLKSQGVRTDFGFLGDVGNLPPTLDDLVIQGTQPAFAFDSGKRVGAGWKGPYITLGPGSDAASHKRDAFGNDYTYDTTDFTNGNGQVVDGKLVSLGADGVAGGTGVNEDVTLEVLKAETTATVAGFAFDNAGNPLSGAGVDIHFPASGALTSSTTTTDSTGFYQFTDIPFGIRSVTLSQASNLSLVPGSVTALGGANQHVEFKVVNFSSNPITVHSLIATFTPVSGPAFYNEVRWNGVEVFRCAGGGLPKASGDTTVFSADQTVAAGAAATPLVSVPVAASFVQVADITLTGAGTEATVQFREFRDDGSRCRRGARVDMTGANFTITLRDPADVTVGQFSFTVP